MEGHSLQLSDRVKLAELTNNESENGGGQPHVLGTTWWHSRKDQTSWKSAVSRIANHTRRIVYQ